ncbi:MAG TPA: hypothetical protein VG326_04290 [Tepidisphaeraceae bacterium]|jgi:hypothetical protein|nr:hypothetical protein [Tepidisphaeraceae bacterium]
MKFFTTRRDREMRRDARIRQARGRVQSYLQRSHFVERDYWRLGSRALQLGDRERFRRLALSMVRACDARNRWERYLLELDALSIRRDEVTVGNAFLQTVQSIADSMLDGASPDDVAAVQIKLAEAMSRAKALNDALDVAIDAGAEFSFEAPGTDRDAPDPDRIERMMRQMREGDSIGDRPADPADRVEALLTRIESTMRADMPNPA